MGIGRDVCTCGLRQNGYFLWRRGVKCICWDASHETPDVIPCRTSPLRPVFVHVSRDMLDALPFIPHRGRVYCLV